MSSTPHDPSHDPDVIDLGDQTVLPAHPPAPGSGRRRNLAIGGGLLAVALVGGGVTYGVAALRSDGAGPETSIPASAFALVKVDLDPSAGQKVDALRFARKFPDAKDKLGSSDDPRKALFDALRDDDSVKGDWAKDVEPWLGQRAAIAVVPGATAEADPEPILVLAVTDADAARTGLRTVSGGDASCVVSGDFAVCAGDEATATKAVADADRSSIADDASYGDDIDSLGGEGIALGWVDVAKAASAVPALNGALSSAGASGALLGSSLSGDRLKGRYVTALRFDGPNLELIGRVDGADLPAVDGTSGVGDLPADTVAALGTGGMSSLIDATWSQLRGVASKAGPDAGFDAQVAQIEGQLGLKIPGDIKDAMGDRVAIAFGGLEGAPKVALRVSGKPDSVAKLVKVVNENAGGAVALAQASAGTDTVVASSQAYADAVAKGSGLGSDPAFTAAVPNAKDAQQIGYLNVQRLLASLGDVDLGAETRRNLEPLSALGMTTGREGSTGTFTLRLTTR